MSSKRQATRVVSQPEAGPPGYPRSAKLALSAFILFHIVAIVSFCFPLNTMFIPAIKNAVRPYMLWTGLFQAWDMFAPEPRRTNIRMAAEVTFRDGATRLWRFPEMNQLGYFARYAKERYRKYSNDNLRLDENALLWPDAARQIARINNTNPNNPPVAVRLVRSWADVPGPDAPPDSERWYSFVFYRYTVAPGDVL